MNSYIQILFAASIATVPSICIKKYIKNDEIKLLFLAIICYLILIYMYIHIYKKIDISRAYPSILTLQIILITIVSMCYFKEKMTKNKMIGISTGLLTIYFLTKKC
jgi:multidrug transporter EmrE-like cation transporter